MFQHYLITRFNLKKEGWDTSKNNIPVLTEEWLERRFKLFETFCFPSVKHQSNQNFTWFVYFDVDTPKVFKDRILTQAEKEAIYASGNGTTALAKSWTERGTAI